MQRLIKISWECVCSAIQTAHPATLPYARSFSVEGMLWNVYFFRDCNLLSNVSSETVAVFECALKSKFLTCLAMFILFWLEHVYWNAAFLSLFAVTVADVSLHFSVAAIVRICCTSAHLYCFLLLLKYLFRNSCALLPFCCNMFKKYSYFVTLYDVYFRVQLQLVCQALLFLFL